MADTSIFKGASVYSADFSQLVERAVGIAGLPIRLLSTQKTELTEQQTDLEAVNVKFSAMQEAIGQIGQALDGSSFLTSVSDAGVAATHVSPGVVEGNYSVKVSDIGAYASSMTTEAWVTASGAVHTYQLKLGTATYDVVPADNSAASVAAAINQQHGDKVRASVLNVGSTAAPDSRISLQAVKLGDAAVGLTDDGVELPVTRTVGRTASYEVNGSGSTVASETRTVSIATGLSITMISSSTTPVNITVTRSTAALTDALSAFTDAFNAAVDAVDAQRGQGGGRLQGQSVVQDLARALSDLGTYNMSGSPVGGLTALGLELSKEGRLTFSPFTLMAADMSNSNAITTFLGTADSSGFLKLANDRMKSLMNASGGTLSGALTDLASRIKSAGETIDTKQAEVDQLQDRLLKQMAAADALIATMEQQYRYFSSMFSAMNTANQSYQ